MKTGGASRSPAFFEWIPINSVSEATCWMGTDVVVEGRAGSPHGAWRIQGLKPSDPSGSAGSGDDSRLLAGAGEERPQQQEAPWQRDAHLQRAACAWARSGSLEIESARRGAPEQTMAAKAASTRHRRVSRE